MAAIVNEEFKHGDVAAFDGGGGDRYPYFVGGFERVLSKIGFEASYRVTADVASYFNGQKWFWKYEPSTADYLGGGWLRFCETVRHFRRYTFLLSAEDPFPEGTPDYMPPNRVLDDIRSVLGDLGLIQVMPPGTAFWRAQPYKDGKPPTPPREFTSAPLDLAVTPNRMSPAGIPMFYGADDFETAFLEIAPVDACAGWQAAAVRFEATRALQVLDLTTDWGQKARERPYFARDGREWRRSVEFLRLFSRDVSRRFVFDGEFMRAVTEKHQPAD